MLTNDEQPAATPFGEPYETDPHCEGCGRSLVTRFGGAAPPAECPSCENDFRLLAKVGKIEDGEGAVLEFSFREEVKR